MFLFYETGGGFMKTYTATMKQRPSTLPPMIKPILAPDNPLLLLAWLEPLPFDFDLEDLDDFLEDLEEVDSS